MMENQSTELDAEMPLARPLPLNTSMLCAGYRAPLERIQKGVSDGTLLFGTRAIILDQNIFVVLSFLS